MAFLETLGKEAASGIDALTQTAENFAKGVGKKLAPILENTSAAGIGKAIRVNASDQLPKIIELEKNPFIGPTRAKFPEPTSKDWRVKLSIPNIEPFETSSALLQPLRATNGLCFPYTPTILISHSASYNALQPPHSNYPYQVYSNSQVDQLVITGDFFVQNGLEAQYWIAALHYLRSVTKMFYGGEGQAQGAPPPIVFLDGYGDYVFNHVPVVVTTFTVDMPDNVDYIATKVVTGNDSFTETKRNPSDNTAKETNANMFYGDVHLDPKATSWAPVQSLFSVTCQPLYSRTQIERFSLEKFVSGGYVGKGNTPGFI